MEHPPSRLAGTHELDQPAAQAALVDYRAAVEFALGRRREAEREIERLLVDSPWAETVARLRCLRGIDTLSAVGLCAEVGDFERFAKAGQLMSFLGLVPSESSTGDQRRLGSITKSGSRHARRLLVEAAWHYRREPRPRARAPSGTSARRGDRDLVVGPAAPASHLARAGAAAQAAHDHRGRGCARASGILLGGGARALT
jgi:transposase